MEVEVALLEEHGADAAPETQPLRGLERGSQLNWRKAALYDTRRGAGEAGAASACPHPRPVA